MFSAKRRFRSLTPPQSGQISFYINRIPPSLSLEKHCLTKKTKRGAGAAGVDASSSAATAKKAKRPTAVAPEAMDVDSDSDFEVGGGGDGGGDTDPDAMEDSDDEISGGSGVGSGGCGGRGGRGGGSGGGRDGRGGRGRGGDRGARKQREGFGKTYYAPAIAAKLCEPWSEESRAFITDRREEAITRAEEKEGTAPRAPSEKSECPSLPLMVKLLGDGLCTEPGADSLEIASGVGFRRSKLPGLRRYFDKQYIFDPSNLGVVLGVMEVVIDGNVYVVKSFDHGKYSLEGRESAITQWELLKGRRDGGVTLEDELRRFIIHLATKYTVMKASVVPFLSGNSIVTSGMLWNVDDAIARAKSNPNKIDPESKDMGLDELTEIKRRADTVRDLSLAIFNNIPLKDTLPAKFLGDQTDPALQEFAEKPGSLSQVNCIGGIGSEADDDVMQGILFTGDIVGGGHSLAPSVTRARGSWETKLNVVSKVLGCAYRLGRPLNLLEAYHPLSPKEAKILQNHHSHWSGNLAYSLRNLSVRDTRSANVIASELDGELSFMLRFAVDRSKTYIHTLPPVVAIACGIRDFDEFGRVGLDSLDTSHFEHTRAASGILDLLLGTDSSSDAVQRILDSVDGFFQNARNLRETAAAVTGGGIGDCSKIRKSRVALVEDSPEQREKSVDMLMEALDANGCRRVMEAVERIDPGIVAFLMDGLVEARTTSMTFDPNLIVGVDHLLGKTLERVAEGKKRVEKLLEGLEEEGFTCKDFVIFSMATALACHINGANLRPQDLFNLVAKTLYYIEKEKRVMIRLPLENKQTRSANKKLSTVCFEHGLEGEDVVRWVAVMALIGRSFLKKANNGELDIMFGPLGMDGKALSRNVFGTVLKHVGAAFFGLVNVDVNAFRTVQDTLAVEHVIELGMGLDALCLKELAREQRTTLEVSHVLGKC